MDRTIRMMRRTLVCAAFACPLSVLSLWLPSVLLLSVTVFSALAMPSALPLWRHRQEQAHAVLRRFFLPCAAGVFCSALLSLLSQLLLPPLALWARSIIRLLSFLTGALLQCALIPRLPRRIKGQTLVSWLLIAGFIVCMLSGA